MFSDADNVATLIEAWALMVGRLPGHSIVREDGVASTFAHVPLPFLNLSILERPATDEASFRAAFEVMRARTEACGQPAMGVVCEPWAPANWESILGEHGWGTALNMTGMVATELTPPKRPVPAGLEFRRVKDVQTATDLAVTNALAYGMPPEMFESICNLHLWHGDSVGLVGYVGGEAVTATAAFPMKDSVYIALVATKPSEHGKGYADAVMRQTIAEAKKLMGLERVTLHATDMGRPVYAAMGFEAGSRAPVVAPGH